MYLCTCVNEEGGDGEDMCSETPSLLALLSYILRYVSFTEVGNVCRVALREPMNLCRCVSEEGDDGEASCSETPFLLSYTIESFLLSYTFRYVSLTEVGRVCRVAFREPIHQNRL